MLFGSYEMMMNTMRDQLLAQQQASAVARPAASPFSVSLCAARPLNTPGQSLVALSLRYDHGKGSLLATTGGRGLKSALPKTMYSRRPPP